jgi:hypothetical protein
MTNNLSLEDSYMENMIKALVAQGISQEMAESMVKSFKPKKDKTTKKGNGFFVRKPKVTIDVEVTVICECCGATDVQIKAVECVNGDSPSTMKLPISSCPNCIEYFRALTHEQLVSLALAAHNPSVRHSHPRAQSQVKLAKRLTPEEMLNFTVKTH